MLTRRTLLGIIAASGTIPAWAVSHDAPVEVPVAPLRLGEGQPFDRNALLEAVRTRAKAPYEPVPMVPAAWRELTYDQYRKLTFQHDAALWKHTEDNFALEAMPPGLYFERPVALNVVEGGMSRPIVFDPAVFGDNPDLPDLPVDETTGYSGLRILSRNSPQEFHSEFVVFQGASYFRAIGDGQTYGLSARALALNTAEPQGEEFPNFIAFHIEKPAADAGTIVVHGVLDSPSAAGLYTFTITRGAETAMEVEATLFAREELTHWGLGAQTSMFLFDGTNRNRFDDFRRAVHDSDGLAIVNGNGEHLWRPLANPIGLQFSSFVDENPRGFGLAQRAREFTDFEDLEAHYQDRPSMWITPKGEWGKGAVTLVEIPADKEIYDNIVTYWRPATPLAKGAEHAFAYRLDWGAEPTKGGGTAAIVTATRMGQRIHEEGRIAVVEFEGGATGNTDAEEFTVHTSTDRGSVNGGVLQRNEETGGMRLAFTFIPPEGGGMELRAQLLLDGRPASEVWLYRWTSG